ncbi:MAG: cation diffusion facilitator family transporter [Candidatus Brocadiaceae bacterium]
MATDPAHVREVKRVTWIGLAVNLLLAALKLAGGILGASQVVIADAVHSLSDSSTDVAILVGVRYWSRPPDRDHPHGHRRIEAVITVGIGLLLAVIAVGLSVNAVTSVRREHLSTPGLIAVGAATVSIISKELLYRWTVHVGRRVESSAVLANAWHHRSDALSSVPAVLAVAGARLHPSLAFLDHLGAVVVSVFIFRAGIQIALPALKELVDAGASAEELDGIRDTAFSVPGVRAVHAIRARRLGNRLQVDLHILVDGAMSVREGHELSEQVKRRLVADGPGVVDVVVHLEPHTEGQAASPP